MGAFVSEDVCNQSPVYPGTAKSVKPSSSQGYSEGDDKYQACFQYVDVPARWGYAITMESEKAKYKQIKAKYKQIKAKYEQIKAKYEQVNAKFEQISRSANQTCECNTLVVTDQHTKDKTKFNDQETLLKMPTDNSVEYLDSLSHEIMKSRMSRTTVDVCTCTRRLHYRRKREREPSRIPYRRVIKLFRKTKVFRNAAKLYLKKSIPSSSKLKLLLSERNRSYFSERSVRSKFVLPSKKFSLSQNVYLSVVRLRTLKHKKLPLFCMRVNGRTLKKLKHIPFETYCVSHRVISLSGDVEENPGPSNQCSATNTCNLAAYRSSMVNSVSLLETRLSELNRTAVDVGGGGDCFFRAVSHQLYGNPNNHSHIRSLGVQYLLQNPEQFIESNTDHSWQDYLSIMSCQGTWADAIIIQAVANCLNLSIHIAESIETFAPVTVVQAVNVTGEYTDIYIGHISETHYVSTVEKRNCRVPNNKTCDQSIVEKKKN